MTTDKLQSSTVAHCCGHHLNLVRSPGRLSILVGAALAIILAWTSFAFAQVQGQNSRNGDLTPVAKPLSKSSIERRFRSIHPVPLQHFGNAVPGARLLSRQSKAAALIAAHQRATSMRPMNGSQSFNPYGLPGIQLRPTLPGGEIPTSVVTGDFNKDGIQDFVVANALTNDLWLYLGKGDGTFQLPRVIPLSKGLTPIYLATADLRGNGTLDLVVSESDTSTIGVLLGNGDGTFGYETEYTLPQPPLALVIADFNKDGKLDIAASMSAETDDFPVIALLTGDGTGNFSGPTISHRSALWSYGSGLAAADVNGDGLPDLLLIDQDSQGSGTGATIYLNNGDGTFSAGQNIVQNSPESASQDGRLADVNEDGCPDALIADEIGGVWVALGDCNGRFGTPTLIRTGESNAAIQVADVNGDGHLDIVMSTFPGLTESFGAIGLSSAMAGPGLTSGDTVVVLLGDGKGNFSVARNYLGPGQSTSLAVADFNGDGHPDIVTANNDTDSMSVYLNDGSGGYGFPQGIFVDQPGDGVINAPVSGVDVVDLNGDGKPDVVFLNSEESSEYYLVSLVNDGTGKFETPNFLDLHENNTSGTSTPVGDFRVANFRGGSSADFVAVEQFDCGPGYILFAPGNGDGTFGTPVVTQAAGASGTMTVGDFNGDGKLDFGVVDGTDKVLTAFLGNGDGTFHAAASTALTEDAIYTRVYSGDFNRDGRLDVLAYDGTNLWEFDGNGDGTFQAGREVETALSAIALGDLNGDGQPDLGAFQNDVATNSGVTTYLGNSDGTFTQGTTYNAYAGLPVYAVPYAQSGDPLASSLIADYNHDGEPEIVDFQNIETTLQKYGQFVMNNGDGTFTPTYDVFPFYLYGWPAYAHDLDGDGYTDMLELDTGSSTLHVVKGGPAPALQIALNDEVVSGNASCGYVFPDVVSSSDRAVTLFSTVTGVQLPSTVTLPAQATSVQFCYTLASNFDYHQVFDITASMDGSSATAYASDSYSEGFTLSVTPNPPNDVYAGQTTSMTVSITPAAGYSSTVNLSCSVQDDQPDTCSLDQTKLTLTPGQTSTATVTLATSINDMISTAFTVAAADSNITHRQSVSVPVQTLSINASGTLEMSASQTSSFNASVNGIPPYQVACSSPSGIGCSVGTPTTTNSVSVYPVTVITASGTAPGTYTLKLTATSGGLSASTNETVNVVDFTLQSAGASGYAGQSGVSVPLTATGLGGSLYDVTVTCSADFGGSCTGSPVSATSSGTQTNLSVNVPQGTLAGQHNLTVTGSYALGANDVITHTYTVPFTVSDFSGSVSTSSMTMTPSSSAQVNVTVTGTAGFSGTIDLNCSGASEVSCTFSGNPVVNANSSTVTLTLTTSSAARLDGDPLWPGPMRWVALAGILPMLLLVRRRSRGVPTLLTLVAVGVLLSQLSACSSGGSAQGGGTPPPSSYVITVNGTIAGTTVAHTLGTITVTVDH